ncbi:MAG: aspartate 1-decarboxylase [Bacteroidetes bacterium]|nr:MAG: aspartate 1-decarboxylase [Bacteroidota bacterium]
MNVEVIKSKIHRVKITNSNLNYIGSITIDEDLMDASNIIEGEKIYVVNINNGERFSTYTIKGKRKSGDIILNGPAARKVLTGDIIIIIAYATMDFEEAKKFKPSIIFPNENDNSLT